jgi:site-specific DNA-methyltransferase (adenine-specific)
MLTITNEDNMELMARYPDKHFDLAICDPPYFNGPEKLGYYGAGKSNTGINRPQYNIPGSWNVPGEAYYKELKRVSKEQIIWGINYFDFSNVPHGRIVWDKKKNDYCTFSDGEIASNSLIETVIFFRYRWDGALQENMKRKEIRFHPTQKPVALYKWLLSRYAQPGWKILDTHFGSGSSGIACHDLGFDLTACEIDKDYYAAAMERIREYQKKQIFNFTEGARK